MKRTPDLVQKDYLTIQEAAAYCCVGLSTFYEIMQEIGLQPFRVRGRNVSCFRKADLQRFMEQEAAKTYGNPIKAQR